MTNTLITPRVDAVLSRLFAEAARDAENPWPSAGNVASTSARDRANALQDRYMPVSAAAGRLLYALTRATRPQTVVEFGTSFGISTIYLAAAVADNGRGQVISTELSERKIAAARSNLEQAGLAGVVTIRDGDARDTLADLPGPVGLVLLDGWKDLYLPVIRLLEPALTPGALVLADDSSFPSVAGYLDYVRAPGSGYVNVDFPVEDGMEISSWTGPAT